MVAVADTANARAHTRAARCMLRAAVQVFDPLLEKGKGKFSKANQKEAKRNNEWAGRSHT